MALGASSQIPSRGCIGRTFAPPERRQRCWTSAFLRVSLLQMGPAHRTAHQPPQTFTSTKPVHVHGTRPRGRGRGRSRGQGLQMMHGRQRWAWRWLLLGIPSTLLACAVPPPRTVEPLPPSASSDSWPADAPVEGLYELDVTELQDTCDLPLVQPSYVGHHTNVLVQRMPESRMRVGPFSLDFRKKPVDAHSSAIALEFSGKIETRVTYNRTSATIYILQDWKNPTYAHYFAEQRPDCITERIYRFQLQQPCSGACLESPPPIQVTPSPGKNP
jgi:hypothetical protein